jgi:PAS domain S-box-containing protein
MFLCRAMPTPSGRDSITLEIDRACAEEPIQIIGTVQPHGFLLVVGIAKACIVQVSSGIARHWPGLERAAVLLDQPLTAWVDGLGADPGALLRSLPSSDPILLPLRPRVSGVPALFECVGHRVGNLALLEWQSLGAPTPTDPGEFDALMRVTAALVRLREAKSLDAFYRDCVVEVSRFCGFGRVMLYRFLPDWTGEVVAEEVSGGLEARFLGLRFPASDIPRQARELYAKSRIRVLADVDSDPDTLLPPLLPGLPALDQSYAILRGLSAVHRVYLGNMGVRATLSLSIVCDGKLWGLIACHHPEPRGATQAIRVSLRRVCELIGEVIALRIDALSQIAAARESVAFDEVFSQFQQAVLRENDIEAALTGTLPQLLDAFQAEALCLRVGQVNFVGGQTATQGPETTVLDAVAGLFGDDSGERAVQFTDLLTPGNAVASLPEAAGLMAVRSGGEPCDVCALLRHELVQEVSWAGEPVKRVVATEDGRVRLDPRLSFGLWKEAVAGTARAWTAAQAKACERLLQVVRDAAKQQARRAKEEAYRYRAQHDHLDSLRRVNETLESRVAERTAQYEELNRRLVEEGTRFAIGADAAGLGFWNLAIGSGVLQWDERMFRLYGHSLSAPEPPFNIWSMGLHPEDRRRCEQEWDDACHGTHAYDTEFRILHPNGAIRYLKAAGRIMHDNNAQTTRMLGVTFDITERKQADEQFRLAIEAAPTGMLLMTPAGSIVLVNAQIERLFGYARAELLGRPIEMLVPERSRVPHPDYRQGFVAPPNAAMGADPVLYGLRKDRSEVPIELGVNPLYTSEGEFVLCSIVDLSHRLEIDRIRTEFVSTVSHELRTPLTSISGALRLLEAGAVGVLPEKAAAMVKIAYKNSERLARLINDILDIGTLEAGKLNLRMLRVDVADLLRQSVEANSSYAERCRVRFVLEDSVLPAVVLADPDRLMQVLANLLSNAAKFSATDSAVRVRLRSESASIRVEVEDTGSGIPQEFQSRIFEKFAQADSSASRRFEGSGLGLSIARKLVEAMDGRIGFTGAAGGGTIFYFELPRVDAAAAPATPPRPTVTETRQPRDFAESTPGSHALPKLLYVEDDEDLVAIIRETLSGRAEIVAAASLQEAERRLRAEKFELIILDQALPDGNGISLVDRIPALLGASVPIVVLSAADVPNDAHRKVAVALAKAQVSPAQVATTILSYLPPPRP